MKIRSALLGVVVACAAATSVLTPPATAGEFGVLFNCGSYPSNKATSRGDALARSVTWIQARVPYSQSACHQNQHGNFRTDCSGYVSMIWGLRQSYTTATLDQVSHPIARADLRPGDALNRPGDHVALFVGWSDAARTKPLVREQAGPNGAPTTERVWSASYAGTYTPIRYDNIVDTPVGEPAGPVLHEMRNVDGSWTGFAPLGADAKDVAITALADGTAQAVIIGGGDVVYHRARLADGSWTPFYALNGAGTGAAAKGKKVAIAAGADGSAHVVIVGWDGNAYHRVRAADGSWTDFAPLGSQAHDVAITGAADGSAQVVITGGDDVVYHRVRAADGSWTGFAALNGAGTGSAAKAKKVSIAAGTDGSAQLAIVGWDDRAYHRVRAADGSWTEFAQFGPAVKDVAIAGLPDGSAQVVVSGADDVISHRVRAANGSWTDFAALWGFGANAKGRQVAIAGAADGTAHVVITSL